MNWTFKRLEGELLDSTGKYIGSGYSGRPPYVNNPTAEQIKGEGPIPAGLWYIGTFFNHPHLGPCVSHLSPIHGTNTYGRMGFFIHGDNEQMNRTASDGCIVLSLQLRELIKAGGVNQILSVM